MRRRIRASNTSVLDFHVMCRCGNHAVAFLEIHAIDYCTRQAPTRSAFLCRVCLARDIGRIAVMLVDGPQFCSSCGLTIDNLYAMVVTLCPTGRFDGQ